MTSQINPNNINGNFPVAGIDNPSTGFRQNFTNTASNFTAAASEISDLQAKAVLKAALTGTTLNNDMSGALVANAQVQGITQTTVAHGTVIGTVAVAFGDGAVQTLTTAGAVSLAFSGWPAPGIAGSVTLVATIASSAHTVTVPAAVSLGGTGITGFDSSTNTISFAAPGTYSFTFTTTSSGATITMSENNTALREFNSSSEDLSSGSSALLSVNSSYFTTSAPSTATLAMGVEGQVKTFAMYGAGGTMIITVTDAGWKSGGSGTITMSALGSTATLKVIGGRWFAIGAVDATFA